MAENRRAPRISVQRRNAASLVEGQLGTGALIAPDSVLLTGEVTRRIAEAAGPIEIVLGPAAFAQPSEGSRDDAVVERREVVALEILGVGETDGLLGAQDIGLATMAAASAYLPVLELPDPPGRAALADPLRSALAAGGDLWAAFEQAGLLPEGLREEPDREWLTDAEHVLARHAARFAVRRIASLNSRNPLCRLIPWAC